MPDYHLRSVGMNEMYCELQSRGIKRKFAEDDQSGDETQPSVATNGDNSADNSPAPTIVPKVNNSTATKINIQTALASRVLHQNLTVQQCYVRHRQQIFNISMCKLNRFRQSPDPSLFRSVLICNTLRTLERELDREGVKINFGPNGVSFIPPVLNTQSMTLDPPPSASHILHSNQNNTNINTSVNSLETPNTSTNTSSYPPMSAVSGGTDSEQTVTPDSSNGEYDKYLMDLDSSSGRVTPFHKPLSPTTSSVFDNESSMDFTSTSLSLTHSSANSAFWGSDEASDRLTNINWSSVLNFNSSVTCCSSGAHKSTQFCSIGHQNNVTNGSDGSVSSNEDTVSPSNGNSSVTSNKSNTCSFTTLLPPTTSSSATTPTITSISVSTVPSLSSTLSHNSMTTNITNSHSVNHLSVINANSITYSNNSPNDEIFGDIDLSLYDFDLLSPLSPPNVKLASITAEELIRTISSTDSMCSPSITMTSASVTSSISSSLSSSLSSSSLSSNGSSVCSQSNGSTFHGRYFKSTDKLFNEDRDQQAITPVMS